MSLLREACPEATRTLQLSQLLLRPPPHIELLSPPEQSFFVLPFTLFLPEGRDWLCFPIQYIQEAVNRQLIN